MYPITHSFLSLSLSLYADGGLNQFNGLSGISEDDDESTYADGISKLSTADDDAETLASQFTEITIETYNNNDTSSFVCGSQGCRPKKTKTIHGSFTMENQCVLDDWTNAKPQKCTSLQIRLPSGTDIHKEFHHHLSSCQRFHASTLPFSPNFMACEPAFFSWMADNPQACLNALQLLKNHPKTVARKVAIAKLIRRNPTAEIRTEQRIPLPRKCRHELATSYDGDDTFVGDKVVNYPNGETHIHIEHVEESKDDYRGDKKNSSVHNATMMPPTPTKFPAQGFAAAAANNFSPPAGVPGPAAAAAMDDDNLTAEMEDDVGTAVPTTFATAVETSYDGAAERSVSGKSVKRRATNQDNLTLNQDDDDDDEVKTVYSEQPKEKTF